MKKFFLDLKKYVHYMFYAAKSDLKAEVANSYLNWVWWILEPLCFMAVYVVIFGYLFGAKEQYFGVYVFIGITMWDFFDRMMKDSVKMVKNKKPIVSKIYVPKYVLVIQKMLVSGFKMLIGFAIVVVMMICYQVEVSWRIVWMIPIMIGYILITFGLSNIVLHFGVFVEDLANVLNIILRLVFYGTGIFYNLETRAGKIGTFLNRYNPIALLISSTRRVLLYKTNPEWIFMLLWIAVGIVLSAIGVILIQKHENSYVKVI